MKIAIIGCGYVGYAVSKYWQSNSNLILTVTTTNPQRVPSLETVAQKVVVTLGNDLENLQTVLKDQQVVLLSVGAKTADSYEETYVNTAKTLVSLLPKFLNIQQVIYTGSYSIYGDRNGIWVDEESPPAPANRNSQLLRKTEDI